MTVREPEWTRREVNLLIASEAHERGYNRFGIPSAESTSSENQFAYVGELAAIDYAEQAVGAAQDAYYKNDDKDHPMNRSGHQWSVKRRATQ